MIRICPRIRLRLITIALFLTLLSHGVEGVQVEPSGETSTLDRKETHETAVEEDKAMSPAENDEADTNDEIPVPSCERIDYSQPEAYLPLNAHFGNEAHILEIASAIDGKTPEDKLVSIHRWIQSNLVCEADTPYVWRDFDRLVRDGNYGGCAEYSLVFGALARACGIPTVWVKTLDADWIRGFRLRGREGSWNGHVFLEVFLGKKWVLLDDVQMVLYEDYDPKMRILPGNRYAYDKGGDPFDLVLSSRWELWKKQTRAFCRDLDLSRLPVGEGRNLLHGSTGAASNVTSDPTKYPAVFVFFSRATAQGARLLNDILYPRLTHHLTGRYHTHKDYQEQFSKWTKPGDTLILLLLANEKDQVPVEFRDLLPTSWTELEGEVSRDGAVRQDGESRGMHVILCVAKSATELTGLIQRTEW